MRVYVYVHLYVDVCISISTSASTSTPICNFISNGYVYIYPTAFGPPPPGLLADSQQTNKQESQQTNKATRNQLKQLPNQRKNRQKFVSRGSLGDPGVMLGSTIDLGVALGGVWGILRPSWPQEQLKTPKGEEPELQGLPWDRLLGGQVGPRWGQVGAKWVPNSKPTCIMFSIPFLMDFGSLLG